MKSIVLSRDQETALFRISAWLKGHDPFFILDGPAGSGKTELARAISGSNTIFCSFTGKAANVLRGRGLNASTVHRVLYKPKEKSRQQLDGLMNQLVAMEDQLKKTPTQRARDDCERLKAAIRQERKRTRSPSWLVPIDAAVKSADLVVVDEYSMLDDKIVSDLRANAKKVLFLGDPFQLPPVNGRCPLNGKANYALTEAHRQALENPILAALTKIREGGAPPPSLSNEHGTWENITKKQATWDDHYGACDQLIVAKNATRAKFNRKYRDKYGYTGIMAQGERVIFLKNDHDMEVFNGSTATVTDFVDSDELLELFVHLDDGRDQLIDTWSGVLRGHHLQDGPRMVQAVDYRYAITCHKAQGSEYDHVAVWNEQLSTTDHLRWMYTACSRARNRCTFINTN